MSAPALPPELAALGLVPHPEGGFFRETWRSASLTTIDYALPPGGFSAWHRVLGAEEVWTHHRGGRLALHLLDDGGLRTIELGRTRWSAVVPAGCWQAAEAMDGDWALVGCTVAPPFAFERFEMADRGLLAAFPAHVEQIARLLR